MDTGEFNIISLMLVLSLPSHTFSTVIRPHIKSRASRVIRYSPGIIPAD